jgi:hypothetical protein
VTLGHAELGASKAERWINCAGSVNLCRGLRDEEGPYAREGTAAHKVGYLALTRTLDAGDLAGTTVEGVEVTDEMADAVQVFVDEVRIECAKDPASQVWYEQEISLAAFDPPGPMHGTSDCFVFSPARRRLVVFDYKHGAGVVVEAEGNAQARYYALGALLKLERELGIVGQVDEIEIVIVQPRAYHADGIVRRELVPYLELVEFAGFLFERASATLDPRAPLAPGAWCKFCPAAGTCPALKTHAMEVAMVEFGGVPLELPPPPSRLTNAQLATLLDNVDIVEDFIRAARATAQTKLEAGEDVPGWKLVPKRAMRKWKDEGAVIQFAIDAGLNDGDIVKTTLHSPAQLEKMLKPLKVKLPSDLYTQESSGSTIAPAGDRRQEVSPVSIADVFSEAPLSLPPAATPQPENATAPSTTPTAAPEPAAPVDGTGGAGESDLQRYAKSIQKPRKPRKPRKANP